MTSILPGIGAGAAAGGILLFLAHIAPRLGAGNFVRDIDRPELFGKEVTHREAHFVGIFTHLVMSAFAGGMFAFLVDQGVVTGFDLLPILVWGGVILSLAIGGIVMPLEGQGLFGIKHDAWFTVDLVITNIFWGFIYWWLIHLLLLGLVA